MRFFALCITTLLVFSACSGSGGDEAIVASTDAAEQTPADQTAAETAADQTAAEQTPGDQTAAETPAPEPAATDSAQETTAPETAEEPGEPEAAVAAETESPDSDGLFPVVVDANASSSGGTSWRVNVTLSSEYDTPERYADAWRVLDADDNELGVRVLTHDHANEQPFTRSHSVEIPEEVATVFVEGRDQRNGWSGERFELTLER